MNAWVTFDQAIAVEPIEAALMDVARALQPTPSQHNGAEEHYNGLSSHVENSLSDLRDKVDNIYGSGSFAINAAIRSSIRRNQHDVDAVIELRVPQNSDPEAVLNTLYNIIKGAPGSRYYDFPIRRNSRCITVTYPDGVTVDLMPVVRAPGTPDTVSYLFHHKPETGEKYTKIVNPKGFAEYFNRHVEINAEFARSFDSRRMLVEGHTYGALLAKANLMTADEILEETAELSPLPAYLPLDQKAPRVIALQLIKRYRDKQFRKLDAHRGRRKPPSVVLAALALDAGRFAGSLLDELISVATYIYDTVRLVYMSNQKIVVRNPAWHDDIFTDRWPEDVADQRLWLNDLETFLSRLKELRRCGFDPSVAERILTELFGESASRIAVKQHYLAKAKLMETGNLGVTPTGGVRPTPSSIAPASAGLVMPSRPNTYMGGKLKDDLH